ncbi:hypothetical protein DFQ04_0645 [Algoriphagus boseongensis]|uniref:Uncharacterized protein n=1 Tax=Algoriphagus boseongensis TaxID=1442587 RepID=A0A4V3D2G0_9BACT|nr:hypothetical protein [Algoriphagus boseongensis]TDQ18837.1 hypothetical protein DFQ04_0645 [Algoriphagus boseongensis]
MSFDFDPIVGWPLLFLSLLVITLAGFLPIYFHAKKGVSIQRTVLKSLFLIGFLLSFGLILLRPYTYLDPEKDQVLVFEEGLKDSEIELWKDSLQFKKAVSIQEFEPTGEKIFLLGRHFTKEELYALKGQNFEWVLPQSHGELADISWKGYLRKGEIQRTGFEIFSSSDTSTISLQIPDFKPVKIEKGWNQILLEFPSRGQGRSEIPLLLDQDTITTIRYFVGPSKPKNYHFQLGFPGAESRNLANWLREKGERVSEEIRLSRETFLSSGNSDSLQVRIIDPSQLEQKEIQNWVKEGKGALVIIQVSKPEETAKRLNQLFGTDFQVSNSGSESGRVLKNGMNALPFAFEEKPNQKLLAESSIAIQNSTGSAIAMSLLETSFPLLLQGKEEDYESVWGTLFGLLEPDEFSSWRLDRPVLSGIPNEIQVFDKDSLPSHLIFETDTIGLKKSLINPFLASLTWSGETNSWISLSSEMEFAIYAYSDFELPTLHSRFWINELKANSISNQERPKSPISPWFGLIGMLLFLGLLWLEPKWK